MINSEQNLAAQITWIAKIVHDVNRAYCQAIGDNTQVPWEEAAQWQRDAAIAGVIFLINNETASSATSHDEWMAKKIADGWVYGIEKNPELKQHPCIVPYETLPKEQQAKDYIFHAIVRALYPSSAPC